MVVAVLRHVIVPVLAWWVLVAGADFIEQMLASPVNLDGAMPLAVAEISPSQPYRRHAL